ncbi:MAG: PIN domain-containing protein [Acidobacteria bacterium]|nr:PIN domain-containing protein [Acidobacteriota bacterium]
MRAGESIFVDTGAWIALALTQDPLHARAVDAWAEITTQGARLHTSVPIMLETFTFLDRHARRDVALAWKDSLDRLKGLRVLTCTAAQMKEAWRYFERQDLHKLSAVDATSFVLMADKGIRLAFTFDHHFASTGFRLVG